MQVLMPVYVTGRLSVQSRELLDLRLDDVLKLSAEERVVHEKGVLARSEETDNAIVRPAQAVSDPSPGEPLREIEVQSRMDAEIQGSFSGSLGVLHENHGGRRRDSTGFVAGHHCIGLRARTSEVISVDDDHRTPAGVVSGLLCTAASG